MKNLLVCALVVYLTTAAISGLRDLPERPDCSVDPIKDNAVCNILPPGCRNPNCGRDYNYKNAMWFAGQCYMNWYNKLCGTNFQKTSDFLCNRNERPPPSFEPCPFPIRF